MSTLILQSAGRFIGGLFGPVGAVIGSAVGALAGYAIDRQLLGGSQRYEGPRLSSARPFSAEEGTPLPRLYGTVRTGGTLIWATRFEETSTTTRQGAKGGGPKTTTYSYFANAAFALCEGEIAGVRRIWADGREVDRSKVEIRIHRGSESQLPDPLIEAKQGSGNAPAYRGTAYAVIERMPIDDYGRRLPQLQFEVLRPVGRLHKQIRSVSLIPGATEYGLAPSVVWHAGRPGEQETANRHTLAAGSDLEASLDELQMLFPNLETISLVVAWFGTDLRAGHCRIEPMVVTHRSSNFPIEWTGIWSALGMPQFILSQMQSGNATMNWTVSGLLRKDARLVSRTAKGAAYGGTPAEESVIEAIKAIRQRGLKVWLYPFIMMDVPAGNTLPNPYGGASQPPYPWRGRITCHPAAGVAGSVDKTAIAASQVAAFAGTATPADFTPQDKTVGFSRAAGDWGYRRFLLHNAHLAALAGGVDGFLIGSELRGLTRIRGESNQFPFVDVLKQLAAEVRTILGAGTLLTYGADWTEYFGHQPADGTGDVFFHLDPLWGDAHIDAIGIDNYMPLSDWRDSDTDGENPDGFVAPYELERLKAMVASGEGFDWYYASSAARNARQRTPITDGAYGKLWVFRYKDLVSWWSNWHYDRPGGVEASSATAFVPQSKPIIFTELGCPAIDKGPNQPNVFPDAKSSENALPYFSDGTRSDLAQQRFLAAHYDYWGTSGAHNPISSIYGGPMVDPAAISVWTWDARPFPAFPERGEVWGDSENWAGGHWLNGRASGVSVSDLIAAIIDDNAGPAVDAERADGTVSGYMITSPGTARAAIEPLVELFGLGAYEGDDRLVFETAGARIASPMDSGALILPPEGPMIERVRDPDHALHARFHLDFRDQLNGHQVATVVAEHEPVSGRATHFLSFPGVLSTQEAQREAINWLHRHWTGRERLAFSMPMTALSIEPGTRIRLPFDNEPEYLVTQVEEGVTRTIEARRFVRTPKSVPGSAVADGAAPGPALSARPFALLLDLPSQAADNPPQERFRVAARARPWREQVVLASPETTGFELRTRLDERATIGFLQSDLNGGFEGRFDQARTIRVELLDGALESLSRAQLLNGGNAAAIFSRNHVWEIFQFEKAEETAPRIWQLQGLLRGQLGTGDAMASGAAAGTPFVLLDATVRAAGLRASEIGLEREWRIGPAGEAFGGDRFLPLTYAGGLRALLPLAPVHLRWKRLLDGDVELDWIRRGRVDADGWNGEDIPLGEAEERYRIEIAPEGSATVRDLTVSSPRWTYSAAMIAQDFPILPAQAEVTIRQISARVGEGLPGRMTIILS